jgi:trehalose synthase
MAHYRIMQIEDYEPLVGRETVERIRQKAAKLKGLRVANFNSTYYGGGVAETISSLTLLMNSLGLRTEWRVIQAHLIFSLLRKRCTMPSRAEKSLSPRLKKRSSSK